MLTVAENGNGTSSPHSSTSQLPGFRWLLLALGTTAGNGQLPLSCPHRADRTVALIFEQEAVRAAPEEQPPAPALKRETTTHHPGVEVQAASSFQYQGKTFSGVFPSYPARLVLLPASVPPHRVCCIVFKYNQVWASQISVDPVSLRQAVLRKGSRFLQQLLVQHRSMPALTAFLLRPPPGREQQKVIPPGKREISHIVGTSINSSYCCSFPLIL